MQHCITFSIVAKYCFDPPDAPDGSNLILDDKTPTLAGESKTYECLDDMRLSEDMSKSTYTITCQKLSPVSDPIFSGTDSFPNCVQSKFYTK